MPKYEEPTPRKVGMALLLTLAFLAIYSPFQLGSWELRWREERYAAIALEINPALPNTVVHGEQIPYSHPVFPLLVSWVHKLGLPIELALRLVSVSAVAILAILAWEAGRRALSEQAGIVAAAMMCSAVIVVEKAMDGYPDFTVILFLVSAWLSWFTFGVARGNWNKAWIIAFAFCALAFHTGGWRTVALFICPLIFMRRPMTVWPKLRKPGFAIGVAILTASILGWVVPRWLAAGETPFRVALLSDEFKGYLRHLATFPIDTTLRFLPWTILAWPAFCVAYFPLDENPIFSRFLRTIVISLFFLFWLTPFFDTRSIACLAFPLSVLCGMNYWLIIRRHGTTLHKFLRTYSILCIPAAILGIAFYLLPASLLNSLPLLPNGSLDFRTANMFPGLAQLSAALIIAVVLITLSNKNKLKVFEHALGASVITALFFWSLNAPYKALKNDKRQLGEAFATALRHDMRLPDDTPFPKDLVVYKAPDIVGLYAPCVYMGTPVIKIHSLDALPNDSKTVYMIALKFPVSGERSWEYLTPKTPESGTSDPFDYKKSKYKARLHLLKGTLINKEARTPR